MLIFEEKIKNFLEKKIRINEKKRFRFCLAYVTPGVKKISLFDPAVWPAIKLTYIHVWPSI